MHLTGKVSAGKVCGIVFWISLIIALLAWFVTYRATRKLHSTHTRIEKGSDNTLAAGKTYYFTVTTQWLEIPTGGRRFKAQLQSVNGINLQHEISVNDTRHSQKVTRDMKIGAHGRIQKIFYKLEPDQEFDKALLEFTLY